MKREKVHIINTSQAISDSDMDIEQKTNETKQNIDKHTHKHRSNKSAGVILIDPWTSSNVCDPSTYRVMVVQQKNSGAWGLPKGHLEQDEELLSAAHRELYEETGVCLDELVLGMDYIPLSWTNDTSTSCFPNHLQIKKIHFFVYILMRRGSSLMQGKYDTNEISAVSWMNVCDWFVDTQTIKQHPPRFNRTLSDTAVNLLMDVCTRTSVQLQKKYGYNSSEYVLSRQSCVNLF